MKKEMNEKNIDYQDSRIYGLDILKILAMFFVVLLHVNGYFKDTFAESNMSIKVDIGWHIVEAIAFPAVHLFAMCGAYFMLMGKLRLKHYFNVYLQTLSICMVGLILALAYKLEYSNLEVFQSFFPFIGRAYWFVSDYLALMCLAPFLNIAISNTKKILYFATCVLMFFISICPLLPGSLGWRGNYSGFSLLVLLYFIVACIKDIELKGKQKKICILVYVISTLVLTSTYILAKYIRGVLEMECSFINIIILL